MNRLLHRIILAGVCLLLILQYSEAIPAFARKYDMTCATCHAPFPKLKPFGETFAGNGFQLVGQEPVRYFKDVGDEGLLLMREMPLAIRFEGFLNWERNGSSRTDLQFPWIAKLLSGGAVAKDVAYYFYFLMNERGEIVGLEDAFLLFNNVFGSEVDITVGQFQVSDPLFKRELRLTREDYEIYNTPVGGSSAGLTYDRGAMISYQAPTNTDITLEILNGNGIGAASDGTFDSDKYKNLLLRVSQEAGEHVRIGFFGYFGREDKAGAINATTMVGPDATISFDPIELNLQYVNRLDDRPDFTPSEDAKRTEGAFAELTYSPGGDRGIWFGTALFNWVQSDYPGLEYRTLTLSSNYMLARNVRLVAEYTYNMRLKGHRLGAGVVVAF